MRNRRNLPSPAVVVREALAESRRQGHDFDHAWDRAWGAFIGRMAGFKPEPRAEWKAAIRDTRGEWQAAYEGRETHWSLALAGRESFADAVADYLTDPWAVAAA